MMSTEALGPRAARPDTTAGIRAGRDEVLEAGASRALGRDFRLAGG